MTPIETLTHSKGPEEYLEGLAPAVQELRANADAIRASIETLLQNAASQEQHNVYFTVGKLLDTIRAFTNEEYANMTAVILKKKNIKYLGEQIAIALPMEKPRVTEVLGLLAKLEKEMEEAGMEHGKHIESQLLLAVRTMYPYGINIANPLREKEKQVSFDRKKKLFIKVGEDKTYIVQPLGDNNVLLYPYKDEKGNVSAKRADLPENSSVVIGRDLEETVFGGSAQMKVPHMCVVGNYPGISRGGVQVVRKGDAIFIFDRGSTNGVSVTTEDMFVDYKPHLGKDKDGHDTVGHTQIGKMSANKFEHQTHALAHDPVGQLAEELSLRAPVPIQLNHLHLPDVIDPPAVATPTRENRWRILDLFKRKKS